MEKPKIGFCETNQENGSRNAKRILQKDSNLEVIGYGCLRRCKMCDQNLYALVNSKVVIGETAEQLVEKIYAKLEIDYVPVLNK